MSQREAEPVFCGECQNEVKVESARAVDGQVLCAADLRKRPFLQRLRARKLPENVMRRGGTVFKSFFTMLAALMLVVGVALIWSEDPSKHSLTAGVWMVMASMFVAFFGLFAGDAVDLLLDIFEQLRRLNRG
jgi:sterol desaturase/sphingolipid hydroxylase (fatty acid hydroxylase superfamily)